MPFEDDSNFPKSLAASACNLVIHSYPPNGGWNEAGVRAKNSIRRTPKLVRAIEILPNIPTVLVSDQTKDEILRNDV